MKRLSLLAFTLILACGHDSQNDGLEIPPETGTKGEMSQVPQLSACYQADEWTCTVEVAITRKTNERRQRLSPLTQSFETSFVARVHSLDMQARQSLDHNGFSKNRDATLEANFPGLNFFFSAENVAWMSQNEKDPEAVAQSFVDMWWNSEGHRKNMLGNHTYIGVGVARSSAGIYATQLFH